MKTTTVIAIALSAAVIGVSSGIGLDSVRSASEVNEFKSRKDAKYVAPVEAESPTSARPKVVIANGEEHNFGSMSKGESRSHTFLVKNEGDYPLEIQLKETTCQCTMANLESAKVEPGQTHEVTLTWSPKDYSPEFGQRATISTNDPDRPSVELTVVGKVTFDVLPSPRSLIMSNVLVDQGFTETVYVYGFKTANLEVTSAEFANPANRGNFDVKLELLAEGSEELAKEKGAISGVAVRITGKPGMPIGPIRETLLLKTNQKGFEDFEVPVEGFVRGAVTLQTNRQYPFDAERNRLKLGTINVDSSKSAEIQVQIRGEKSSEVEVTIDPNEIKPNDILSAEVVRKQTLGDLTIFTVRVTVTGKGETHSYLGNKLEENASIVLRTTHPSAQKIDLYVQFALTRN